MESEPSLINTSPEEEGMIEKDEEWKLKGKDYWHDHVYLGWLAKIKLSNPEQIESLMDEKAYAEHCAAEEDH